MLFEPQQNFQVTDMLEKMSRQINKLTSLVAELLDIKKIESGEMEFNFESFDFDDLVKETVEEMQRISLNHKIILDLQTCGQIRGDRNRLEQVIVNFISNAVKYSPDADKIIITSQVDKDGQINLCIRDFGIGIPLQRL